MQNIKSPIICLMGPTASGKTDLAINIAQKLPIQIISVDSALIYRHMNIGTAKPAPTVLEKYPHHLINICDPSERYSAANFCTQVNALIAKIHQQQKIPLLVGRTMMYFNALFKGLAQLPDADLNIRQKLDNLLKEKGAAYLHTQLQQVDPTAADKIHPNDPQRLQRALEVYQITGTPISELWQTQAQQPSKTFIKIAISPADRKVLHQRIEQRFEQMLQQGFLNEVEQLMLRGDLSLGLPAIRCVGYRQAWQHLLGEFDFTTMREKSIIATRQLAKRQLTWLRSFDDMYWFDSCDENLTSIILAFIKTHKPDK